MKTMKMTRVEKFGAIVVMVFWVFCGVLFGCTLETRETLHQHAQQAEQRREAEYRESRVNWLSEDIEEIEIKGHIYLVFEYKDGYGAAGGIVHAAHCPCNERIMK